MRRKLSIACLSAIIIALVAFAPEWSPLSRVAPTGRAQMFTKQPLYRYQSRRGQYLYATTAKLPKGLTDGPWESEGIVCYVPEPRPHGTQPVYQLMSDSNEFGIRYFFTSSSGEAQSAQTAGWHEPGVVFHVAATKLPGTVPIYRLYKPPVPQKKKDKSVWDKIGEAISGPEFTQDTAGVLQDAYFYTIREDEKATAMAGGFMYQGVLGYAWESASPPPAATAPDLTVIKTTPEEFSVTAVVANKGTRNTSGAGYSVSLLVFDKNDKLLFKRQAPAPGMSPNQSLPVKIDTGGQSLNGRRYQVKVDEADAVKESDEDNNETALLPGPTGPKIKVADPAQTTNLALAIDLRDRRERMVTVGQSQYKYVDFDLAVTNASVFPVDAFQPLTLLPPNPCGVKSSDARLFAEIVWGREGRDTQPIMRGVCVPLLSPQDLAKMTFSLREEKGTAGLLQVIVRDRLTGLEHKSNVYAVGAFGVGKALFSVGCKTFLGRADEFLCTTKTGMAACENLRQQGKPIKCRLAN
ncbi:MAG: hypothetical protein LC785_16160 [Acidobacteria bacterium]|nr:hypothetical protein [Acidobacteriota bacterium]MCA1643438.1 hypothetical protein [Acidobacteriota bacterium]